jgi:hypothetical protein
VPSVPINFKNVDVIGFARGETSASSGTGVAEWWSDAFRCSEQDPAIGCWILPLRDKSFVAGQTMDDQLPAGCGISFEFKPSLFFAKG